MKSLISILMQFVCHCHFIPKFVSLTLLLLLSFVAFVVIACKQRKPIGFPCLYVFPTTFHFTFVTTNLPIVVFLVKCAFVLLIFELFIQQPNDKSHVLFPCVIEDEFYCRITHTNICHFWLACQILINIYFVNDIHFMIYNTDLYPIRYI